MNRATIIITLSILFFSCTKQNILDTSTKTNIELRSSNQEIKKLNDENENNKLILAPSLIRVINNLPSQPYKPYNFQIQEGCFLVPGITTNNLGIVPLSGNTNPIKVKCINNTYIAFKPNIWYYIRDANSYSPITNTVLKFKITNPAALIIQPNECLGYYDANTHLFTLTSTAFIGVTLGITSTITPVNFGGPPTPCN